MSDSVPQPAGDRTYSISDAAAMVGATPSALRYYEREGLLPNLNHADGTTRRYTTDDLSALALIMCMKETGMPLAQIRQFMVLAAEGDSTIDERLVIMAKHRAHVENQIDELRHYLAVLDYKLWFYSTCQAEGTCDRLRAEGLDAVPPQHKEAAQSLHTTPDSIARTSRS
ncbi:MAG: MerR family transcriptional regulator [Actinomycetaceae bacterium]|nr:MerR family transcriptional regulator [Actinomycetaceae bacterium]MDU0969430.1 MerR family transcriptional regulator [Actinomycetaceae bacterium]